jgi:hypothetical protein
MEYYSNDERAKALYDDPRLISHLFGYDKLDKIHSDWIEYLFDSSDNVGLQAHRNSYKTTCIIFGIIRELWIKPETTILIVRKTDTLARELLLAVKKILESEEAVELFKLGFKNISSLKSDRWNSEGITISTNTRITVEGNLTAIGIGASITGRHYDLIISDDIVTREDRYSKAERQKTINYIHELLNIVKDSGRLIFTGTAWHKDDAWTAIEHIVKDVKKYYIHDIHPPILSAEKIEELRTTMSSALFAANYEGKYLSDADRFFPEPEYTDADFSGIKFMAYLDPAYKGKNHTALSIAGKSGDEYVCFGRVWAKPVTDCYDSVLEILRQNKVGTLIVESNADKGFSAADLAEMRGSGVEECWETENKHIRIETFVRKNWRNIRFPRWVDSDYLSELLEYEETLEPDDVPDSLAGAIRAVSGANINISDMLLGKY